MKPEAMHFMRYSTLLCVILLSTFGEASRAQTTVPHVFTPGTPARATEMNANFQAVVTAINNLSTRVGKLEGGATDADVVGTYSYISIQIGVGHEVVNRPADIEVITYDGTFTFAADHTFTGTFAGKKNDGSGPSGDDGTVAGVWSLNANTVSSVIEQNANVGLHCTPGCRIMIGTHYQGSAGVGDEGLNNLMIFVRTH
jgi:hypothetical protein